jgi:hypothetical protein
MLGWGFSYMLKPCVLLVFLLSAAQTFSQQRTLRIEFKPQSRQFDKATGEYRRIWADEGHRIVGAMERVTQLRFRSNPIQVIVYEGTSFSGNDRRPMQLRASYPANTKKATLVHELGHRLISDIAGDVEQHPTLFLFL